MAEPIFLKGAVKDYIWGGQKLRTLFGKESESEIIAESWELSCHKDGCSVILNGKNKGLTLSQYLAEKGEEKILGRNCRIMKNLPLIKLIDAKEPLSVQVHPDDHYAHEQGFENGKTEMWYVLEANEGASLVFGVNRELTREEFQSHIEKGTLESILNFVPVHKGDVFFIPAGTLHAIGKGILIAEVQQNSNLTYRVYDYGRLDAEGNPRPLHIEDAVAVTNLTPASPKSIFPEWKFPWGECVTLSYCEYFTSKRVRVRTERRFSGHNDSFTHLLITDGSGTLYTDEGEYAISKGDSVLLPSNTGNCRIIGTDGFIEYIATHVPSAEK